MVIRDPVTAQMLKTSSEVIDAVGGTTAAQKLTKRRTAQSVTNWRNSGRLPPDTFLVFSDALKKSGKRAPCELWGITASSDCAFAGG